MKWVLQRTWDSEPSAVTVPAAVSTHREASPTLGELLPAEDPALDPHSSLTEACARPLRIRLARPELGEEELDAVRRVFASGILTNGPEAAAFESAFAIRHGASDAVSFANGTVALSALLLAAGIRRGDEVIVPSLTFIATATAVCHVGATPVFADVLPDTYNLDPEDVRAKLTPRTRAVLPVHYAGQPAALEELARICGDAGVALLEDAAQAHGAAYAGRPAGSWGVGAMFSFTPTKNITTGEGGIVTTSDSALAQRMRLLRNHGQTGLYRHDFLGYNWRLTELQAAVGLVQLSKLDWITERKRAMAEWMTARLDQVPGITPPRVASAAEPVYMLFTIRVAHDRNGVLRRMLSAGIECRVYFPPVHMQPVFNSQRTALPVTEMLASEILSLPIHAGLAQSELAEIADTVEAAVRAST